MGGKVLFSAVLLAAGWPVLGAHHVDDEMLRSSSCLDVHMLLLSAFFAIFGCFAVALKWLTERSGRQWSWHEVYGGPAQTLGSSQLAGTCGIVH